MAGDCRPPPANDGHPSSQRPTSRPHRRRAGAWEADESPHAIDRHTHRRHCRWEPARGAVPPFRDVHCTSQAYDIHRPMTDTGTAGTTEREVRADAGGAEGRGMDASDDFEGFERTATSELSTHDMVTDGSGEAAKGGGGNASAHAAAVHGHGRFRLRFQNRRTYCSWEVLRWFRGRLR